MQTTGDRNNVLLTKTFTNRFWCSSFSPALSPVSSRACSTRPASTPAVFPVDCQPHILWCLVCDGQDGQEKKRFTYTELDFSQNLIETTCFLKNVLSFYSLLLLLSKADLFIIKVVNLNVWCSKVKQKVKRKNLSTEASASASHTCFFWSWKIFCLTSSSCGITLSFLFPFKSIFQPIISWLTYNIFVAAFWRTSH